MPNENQPQFEPLPVDQLTWASLLGRWVEFARSAVGLPQTTEGNLMRDSVPDIIMLQAVWFALQHLNDLSISEKALGIDRASVLIEKHSNALINRYTTSEMPELMAELIKDAKGMLHAVESKLVKPTDSTDD